MTGVARLLAAVIVAGVAAASCASGPPRMVRVDYSVTIGDRDGDLTGKSAAPVLVPTVGVSYSTATGSSEVSGTEVIYDKKSMRFKEWKKSVRVPAGTNVSLSASNDDQFGVYGVVTCYISADDSEVSKNTATGSDVTAKCTGKAGTP